MAERNKQGGNAGIKVLIVGIILIVLVAGYYYYLTNKQKDTQEENVKATAVQEALMYNFERNYPPTPKEVVKLYGKFAQCLHNETYTEDEFVRLAMQVQKLYDEELIANKTQNQYIEDLRWDIQQMKDKNITISSYATSASTDVYEYRVDGFDFARLYCSFTMRQGTHLVGTNEIFLLRKDADGHWKIYGFKVADEEMK